MVSKITKEQEDFLIKHAIEKTSKEWMVFFNCKNEETINKRLRKFNTKSKKPTRKHTESTKQIISKKRKDWLKDNPDKHPWRTSNKFKSKPCELVKDFLKEQNIQFIEEYDPKISDVNYSIDIAIPDKLIAIEINGNQHYNSDGTLKPYYQNRHNILEMNGWNVYEIHYSHCFKLERWGDLINKLKDIKSVNNFDYLSYVPKQKITKYCEVCSKRISKYSNINKCKEHDERKIKIIWPSVVEMKELIEKSSMSKISKQLGVSTATVSNFCKRNNINIQQKPKKPKKYCEVCSKNISKYSDRCKKHAEKTTKIIWPSVQEMSELVWQKSTTKIAKQLGVSDNAVGKFCKKNNIKKPPRGFWGFKSS